MLLVFFIPYINIGVAFCVKWMIFAMNNVVSWVESMPLSIIKGLYINSLEFACLIVSLLLLMMVIEHKKKILLFGMLSILLIFSASQMTRAVMQRNQMSLTVYSMNRNTVIDFVCGNEHVFLCDTMVFNDPSIATFSIENNLIKEGVYSHGVALSMDDMFFENSYIRKNKNLVSFGDKTIAFFDKNSTFGVKLPFRPYLDYFIIYGRNKVDLEKLLNCYVIDLLVIDGSVPDYLRKMIIEKADEIGQKYYDVKNAGAFVLQM